MVTNGEERRLLAILSAYVVGYTRLIAEDEDSAVRTLHAYHEEIELHLQQHRGRLVDFVSDNLLASFANATDAVEFAVQTQRVLEARNSDLPVDRRLRFRMGIHLGEVRIEGERLFGEGVNLVARLERLADPGGVCISDIVRLQVATRLAKLSFEDLGEQSLKNVAEPIGVFRVGLGARAKETESTSALESGPIRSIAVLPLENLSGDADQEYFADGMTDTLIADLAKIGSLKVISRTSVMR
jgi:adenylate cyclase